MSHGSADRYRRDLASVFVDSESIRGDLLPEDLALYWPGGDESWCN